MADNVTITEGAGTTIAADEVGGEKYQEVKVALGADGAVDGLLDAGQQAMVNSLPVVLASDQSAVHTNDYVESGIRATAVTVGTAPTPMPGVPLSSRRALIIFNNGEVTIYIGGSTVNTGSGLPIPSGAYSPPIAAGPSMDVYAIAGSGGVNTRVLEVS